MTIRAFTRAAVALGVMLSLGGLVHRLSDPPNPAGTVTAAPPIVATLAPRHAPFMVEMPDCESRERTFPCVTLDEDEWRIVFAVRPYTYQPVTRCTSGRGISRTYPCVWPASGGREWFRVFAQDVSIS